MNEEWQSFLQQHGASYENGMVNHYANTSFDFNNINQTTLLADLSHRGMIKITGADAETFLQGQFCNDVRLVDNHLSQLSAYCTPKGRILASFRLLKNDNTYFMNLPSDVLPATLKRLRMFVLRSQVVLDDISSATVQFGISGPESMQLLEAEFTQPPAENNSVIIRDSISCVRVADHPPRFELNGPLEAMKSLWLKLSASARPVASHYWTWLDIHAGIPTITSPVVEAFVPQMVNLHWIDGLSFKKGCYPGQEIVARTHYLGKLKRRMYIAHLNSPACPEVGDEVHRLNDPQGQSAGKILLSHPAPQGGCDVLVVMQIDAVEDGEIIANRDVQTKLQFIDLPYKIDEGK